MSLAESHSAPTTERQGQHVDGLGGLADIYDQAFNLVNWQRTLPVNLIDTAQQLAQHPTLWAFRETVTPESVGRALVRGIPDMCDRQALIDDITLLTDAFCCLLGCDAAGLRIEIVDRAACPRFHVDHVPCRLVTTYHGPATQWLEHDHADRTKLGRGNNGLPDNQSGLILPHGSIQSLQTGDVVLLKGEKWPFNQGGGLVHRSPSVDASTRRLVLTLDPM